MHDFVTSQPVWKPIVVAGRGALHLKNLLLFGKSSQDIRKIWRQDFFLTKKTDADNKYKYSQGPNHVPPPLKNNRLLLLDVPFTTLNHLLAYIAMNHTVNDSSWESREESYNETERAGRGKVIVFI